MKIKTKIYNLFTTI